MSAWSFFALAPPSPVSDAEALIADYLDCLSPSEAEAFHAESVDLATALHLAVDTYLDAHPTNSGPWMWAAATEMLTYCFRENLKAFVAELDDEPDADEAVAPVALEDCDA